jgi:peptidyl-prolyl cis-trans isomerase B (cyclophilin B)
VKTVTSPLLLASLVLLATSCTKNKDGAENPTATQATGSTKEPAKAEPAAAGGGAAAVTGSKAIVELSTTMGTIRLELYPDKAPKTVANFLQYVKEGHYAGTVFHRVIDGFMIQGGGFDATLTQKATREPIQNEADNGLKNARGTVAMARTGDPHSASAQFFISVADNESLDHKSKDEQGWGYCVFGRVVQGMDVVDRIKVVSTGAKGPFEKDVPQTDVVIKEAKAL